MTAVAHIPIRTRSVQARHPKPLKLTVKSQNYVEFVEQRVCNRERRIGQLETEVENLKDDRRAWQCAAGCLFATLAIVLYQWLVVCNGQAPG
ncbi:hypothetical protein PL263_10505 [Methylomonas sp. EFPC3]|uniref:hypothetical protein n=1 Tax=Methylomonas sp. EFPC3 TaxID=3021710 RepID=UPI002416967D|nr:hypothetical protein [Methylomonas sp. EFPC3]WFP48544.1 hypothetical protein PL263_10505 [Methylomonas sp. EFPC3]